MSVEDCWDSPVPFKGLDAKALKNNVSVESGAHGLPAKETPVGGDDPLLGRS